MDKVKQVVDKIVHPKDHSSTTGTTAHSTTTGTGTHTGNHTTGAHTGTHTGNHTTGAHTGTTGSALGNTHGSSNHGPHDSNLANKLNPTVDSDLDGSRNLGAAQHGPGGVHNQQHTSGFTGTGTAGTAGTHGTSTTGPHSSNLANKLDPRVDQSHGPTNSSVTTGSHGTSGLSSSHHGSTNAGPHSSNAMNAVDPRVDSDRDGSRNLGAAQYGPGAHQTHGTTVGSGLTDSHGTSALTGNNHSSGLTGSNYDSGLTGTNHGSGLSNNNHSSSLSGNNHGSGLSGNNYDSGLIDNNHGSGLSGNNHGPGLTGTNHGTHGHVGGPAPNTSGPHKSDLLNKVDPRVDSDRDGSKTVGQAPAPQY